MGALRAARARRKDIKTVNRRDRCLLQRYHLMKVWQIWLNACVYGSCVAVVELLVGVLHMHDDTAVKRSVQWHGITAPSRRRSTSCCHLV